MLVIASIKWIENSYGKLCPVQLAAARVGRTWNALDSVGFIIRPLAKKYIPWRNPVYCGASQDEYKNAPKAQEVFAAFLRWLKYSDTVCFWDEASAAAFQKMLMFILRIKLNNKISLISPTMIKAGRDAGLYSQKPCQVCRMLGIKATQPEQYAPNEVEAIRAILSKTRFNDELVRKNTLPDDYRFTDEAKEPSTESTTTQKAISYHKGTLKEAKPALNNTRRLTKAEKKAVQRHNEAAEERAQIVGELSPEEKRDLLVLTNPGYAFWAAKGYKTFHQRDCLKLKELTDLRGFARYEDAIHAGYTPCKQCNPKPKSNLTVSVPIEQQIRNNEDPSLLDELCDKAGFKHSYSAPEYCIETPAGKWKLIIGTRPLDVFHLHIDGGQAVDEEYHKQHRLFLSLQDTFEYIRRHDSKNV